MRAMTVVPGCRHTAAVETLDEPADAQGELLVSGRLVGVCGTDREIAEGSYGQPPQGDSRLVLGHEGLGEVLEAPVGSGFERGDLVVGIVRRPDPVPCPACAAGQWDMCRNDRFIERGIVRPMKVLDEQQPRIVSGGQQTQQLIEGAELAGRRN